MFEVSSNTVVNMAKYRRTSCTGTQAYSTHSSYTDMTSQCNSVNACSQLIHQPVLQITLFTCYVYPMGGFSSFLFPRDACLIGIIYHMKLSLSSIYVQEAGQLAVERVVLIIYSASEDDHKRSDNIIHNHTCARHLDRLHRVQC